MSHTHPQRLLRFFSLLLLLAQWSLAAPQPAQAAFSITLNGAGTGRTFDGIGALSAGASSRLLIDYPAQQQSEILDYLFKPNYGASLQILKVEIGGDMNSTDGSEPSHMHTSTDENYQRGYEWWLMEQAKARNPAIKISALEWGVPGWIGGGNFWSQDNINYIIKWLNHAKTDHNITVDYIGGWNERGYTAGWYESLRSALNSNGLSAVKVIADDSFNWTVATALQNDPTFNSAVDIVGNHYNCGYLNAMTSCSITSAATGLNKPLWESEQGSQPFDTGAAPLTRAFNRGYIDARMTAAINWSLIWSVYSPLPFHGDGLMLADQPWSGNYTVGQSIWVTAHTAQFTQPGWHYLDSASGYFGGNRSNGSYVTLKSTNNSDYSVVIETLDATASQVANFSVTGGLSTGTVHVWATNLSSSNPSDWFVRQADITPAGGAYSITLQPGYVYTLTTTGGQAKGATTPPARTGLALPYSENFESYALSKTPRLFSDQMGTFETAACGGGRSGTCLRQVVSTQPILWSPNGDPSTVAGDPNWRDYRVTADVLLEQAGYVDLVGRMGSITGGNSNLINGYHLRVQNTGAWSLIRKNGSTDTVLASGTVSFSLNTWHTLSLGFQGSSLSATIDGATVVNNFADGTYTMGLMGFETSSWQNAQFDNVQVVSLQNPNLIPQSQMSCSATSAHVGYECTKAIDGDYATLWHAEWSPLAALPQSITLNLGGTYNVTKLHYVPRQDGNSNGTITSYNIYVSSDGVNFGSPIASGTWADDATEKIASLTSVSAHYLRLQATAGHGGFASAAELNVEQGATTTPGSFVTAVNTGSELRNDFSNYIGMKITVSNAPVTVTQLGRYYVSGNTQNHVMKIIRASDRVELANVTVNMALGSPDALGYKYAPLSPSVTLSANTAYYVVSLESSGGDSWYGRSAAGLPTLTTTSVAAINNGIWFDGANWNALGGSGQSYIPMNLVNATNVTTTIDDSVQGTGQNQFNYAGAGWGHCTNCGSTYYNSSISWDHTLNDSVTVAFTGTQIKFYGQVSSDSGQGAVSIDGGAETFIDFYSATRTGNVLLWTSPSLSVGTHTFKLRVTGNNTSGTDHYISPDRVDVISPT